MEMVKVEEIIEDKTDREMEAIKEAEQEEEEAVTIIEGGVIDKKGRLSMKMNKIKMRIQIINGVKMNKILKKIKTKIKTINSVKPIIMIMINLKNKTNLKNMTVEIDKNEEDIEKRVYKKGIVINKKRSLILIQILDNFM